jgi:hypothetical protein
MESVQEALGCGSCLRATATKKALCVQNTSSNPRFLANEFRSSGRIIRGFAAQRAWQEA